jgi:hypothetical protein
MAQLDYENLDSDSYTLLCPLLKRACQLALPPVFCVEMALDLKLSTTARDHRDEAIQSRLLLLQLDEPFFQY